MSLTGGIAALGSARVSRAGEGLRRSRTLLSRRPIPKRQSRGKSVAARRRNQHAGRVRYPERFNE
jgi:hypothetical protein